MSSSADYHFRQERFFSKPPAAVWPLASDTARFNELAGLKPYIVEERVGPDGRIRRFARSNIGPLPMRWEEGYGEWRENRQWIIVREYETGPMRRMEVSTELRAEGEGCRLLFAVDAETSGLLGLIAKAFGLLDRECAKILAAIERLVRDGENNESLIESDLIKPDAQARLNALAAELGADPASHGLTPNLVRFLDRAPTVSLRGMRPLELARRWHASPDHVVELFLAAAHRGILVMGWDLLCPRCRGAKSRVATLHDLPEGAHCSSCNIDYQRNFTSNVELTFRPESWLRPLPEGEFCLLGPGSAPHVKFQTEVAARSSKTYDVTLAPGPYRFRTVEAGGEADADLLPDDAMPAIIAQGSEIRLESATDCNALAIHNETDRPLYFVIEDRNWVADALTGDRVIAMPVFRRLCPEQLLRPGDDAEIGRITILFTDLVGSTGLYDSLGDATAYNLVRDHFAFLSERVQRHNGFIVKTVGDAVMAAFSHSDDAVRAALAIQDDVAAFNSANRAGAIALKLGLHSGACIAVTAAGVLDYFGATVNIAARLEHQCATGEVVVSGVMLDDPATNAALDGRTLIEDQAILRGFNASLRFVRVRPVTTAKS
jgi:class 3 adenylate cyclase